jgi:chemotaxis methyl-accepting protein methylase
MLKSAIHRKCLGAYVVGGRWVWNHIPASLRPLAPGRMYGRHLHHVVRLYAERKQSFATFFLRNRPELELMRRFLAQKAPGSPFDITVLACSKGAEVYSIVRTIRAARPDLNLRLHAVDISQGMLEFAQRGVYSLDSTDTSATPYHETIGDKLAVARNTRAHQMESIFTRMTDEEIASMFDVEGDQVRIRPWLREGITWVCGNASDPELVGALGPQDAVVANRFLCHVEPATAERCLHNIARLVKPGGHLFVSGVDLDVRTKVAREMGWKPVTDLIREIHEGDYSLLSGWPLEYWGLEPFCNHQPERTLRYAAVFQIGEAPSLRVTPPLA